MDIKDEQQVGNVPPLVEAAQLQVPIVETSREVVSERLQKLAIDSGGLADFLLKLCEYSAAQAAARTGAAIDCSVTLHSGEKLLLVTGRDAQGGLLNELQKGLGDGPGLTAREEQRTILIQDVLSDESWPVFSHAAAALGVHSILAVPLVLDEGAAASINFFASTPHAFDDETVTSGERYIVQAQTVLRFAVRTDATEQLTDDLQDAMKARTTIDLAVGAVMGQQRCTPEAALEFLKRAAAARNQNVRTFAHEFLTKLTDTPISFHFDG